MGRFQKIVPGKKKPQWFHTRAPKSTRTHFYIQLKESFTIRRYYQLAELVNEELNKIPSDNQRPGWSPYYAWVRPNAGSYRGLAFGKWRGSIEKDDYDLNRPHISFDNADFYHGLFDTHWKAGTPEDTVLWNNPELVVSVSISPPKSWNEEEIAAARRAFETVFRIVDRPVYRCGWAIHEQNALLPKM